LLSQYGAAMTYTSLITSRELGAPYLRRIRTGSRAGGALAQGSGTWVSWHFGVQLTRTGFGADPIIATVRPQMAFLDRMDKMASSLDNGVQHIEAHAFLFIFIKGVQPASQVGVGGFDQGVVVVERICRRFCTAGTATNLKSPGLSAAACRTIIPKLAAQIRARKLLADVRNSMTSRTAPRSSS
jgi:hypothetical protein